MWNYVYWVQVMIGISLVPHGSGSKVFRCRDAQSLTTAGPMISEIPFGAWIGARRLETAVVFTAALKGWNNWPSAHSLGRICWLEGLEVVSKLCQGQTLPSNLQDLRNLANTKRIWSTVARFGKDQLNVGREMAPREVLPAKEEAWSSARKGRWKEDESAKNVKHAKHAKHVKHVKHVKQFWRLWKHFKKQGGRKVYYFDVEQVSLRLLADQPRSLEDLYTGNFNSRRQPAGFNVQCCCTRSLFNKTWTLSGGTNQHRAETACEKGTFCLSTLDYGTWTAGGVPRQ